MAAPTPSTRVAPAGIKLPDGYQCLVTIAADTDISFWEKTTTPIPLEGGEPIDQTTQHNVDYITKFPQQLIDTGEGQVTAAYDPAVYTQLLAILNVPTTITYSFYDGSTLAFYGYVKSAAPAAQQRGTQPEMTITIVSTNWDHVNKVEAGPVLTSVSGT